MNSFRAAKEILRHFVPQNDTFIIVCADSVCCQSQEMAPLSGEARIVLRPASQRPHVRATALDWYHVGRGNARLMSQGDGRGGHATRFAEGSRGRFPLLPFFEITGRRETGPGMAFAARR